MQCFLLLPRSFLTIQIKSAYTFPTTYIKISLNYKIKHLPNNKIICRKPGCFLTSNPVDDADQKVIIVGSAFMLIWTTVVTLHRRYPRGNVGNFGCFGHQIVGLIKRVRSTNIYKISLLHLEHNICVLKSFNICK
jgi:hypothetical protein